MGTYRATVAAGTAEAQGRASTRFRPGGVDRHSIRAENGNTMGILTAGNGMRKWDDLLATPSRLAAGGRLEDDLASTSQRTWLGRPNRLDHRVDRQLLGSRNFWGAKTGPNPTDRGKNGSKRHLLTDGAGIPLAIEHTGANCHDSEVTIALVDSIPPIKQPRGRPRKRPDELLADRAYDAEQKIRQPLRERGITPYIAKRNTNHGSGLGKYRYVVEACFDWLFNWRRLRVRYEKRDDIHEAFLVLGCCMICWNRIQGFC